MPNYILAIDLGASFIKIGLVKKNKIINKFIVPTTKLNPSELINFLVKNIENLLKIKKINKNSIQGVGIGLPGPVDNKKGIVYCFPNIKGFKNFPFKKIFQKKIKI